MISVCLISHNGERFIKKQIQSILSQLSEFDELIISDDESTDNTCEIIQSFQDNRIKLFHHKKDSAFEKYNKNKGFYYATANMYHALQHASGEYIFFADQDDIWIENKLQKCVEKLQTHDCVICNYNIIDENDKITQTAVIKNFSYSTINHLIKNHFMGCCMAIKKEVLSYIFPFPKELRMFDIWIGILCCQKKNIYFINEPLHLYRQHKNNVSPATKKSTNSLFYKIQYRIQLIYQLFYHTFLLRQ